jgi:hypothetical protein
LRAFGAKSCTELDTALQHHRFSLRAEVFPAKLI